MLLAGEVDARIILVEADADVGVGLVVAQADVEAGPVALDEALLGEQRLRLVRRDEEVDSVDARDEAGLAAGEVGGDALADRACLADVEQLVVAVVEEVDAGGIGQLATLPRQPLGSRSSCSLLLTGLRKTLRPHGLAKNQAMTLVQGPR